MTISIRLDPGLKTALRRRSSERNLPLSIFMREAISEKLEREEQEASPYAVGEPLFGGCYSSGETDRSERRKQILWEQLSEKRRR